MKNKKTSSLNPEDLKSLIIKTITPLRKALDKKNKGDLPYGDCVKASASVKKSLEKIGIKSKTVKGWCLYDDDRGCSDRNYDEHTWIEAKGLVIDITLDQFEHYIDDPIPKIYVDELPDYLYYKRP